jgi:stage V sporulation protein B
LENRKSSFVKQAAILAAAGIISRIIGFAYRVPLTGLIGDQGNGISGVGYYIYTLLLIISSAGLPAAISKMVSERIAIGEHKNAHRVFKVALIISGATGFIAMCALVLISEIFLKSSNSYYSIIVLAPTVFIVAIMAVFRGYFQGMKNTVPTAISQIIEQIFNAVFSILLAYLLLGISLPLAAAGSNAGTGIGALFGLSTIFIIYIFSKKSIKQNIELGNKSGQHESRGAIAKELASIAFPIIVGVAIFSITNIIDMVMVENRLASIGTLSTGDIEALYGQLIGKYVTITTLPVSIATALAIAVVPSIASSVIIKDEKNVNRKINVAMRLAMIISIPSAVGIGVLADPILSLLFPNFPEGGALLRIGSVSVIFLALTQIITGILQGKGHVVVPAVAAFCGAIVKIPLNYFLIANPRIMVAGAVISTIACYAVASTINLAFLCKKTKIRPDFMGIFAKPIFASIIMGAVCYGTYYGSYSLFKSNSLACLLAILIGMFAYGLSMILIGGIKQEDVLMLPYGKKLAKFLK